MRLRFDLVKRIIFIFIILVVVLQTHMKTAILIHYYLNKEVIASDHCENKNRTDFSCEGRCYLSKKIKQQEGKESKGLVSVTLDNIVLFLSHALVYLDPFIYLIELKPYALFILKPYLSVNFKIIQPPR